ncbi:MAG: CDP-alcohol phosphatidyltransferase [Intrasporangium sp.]|uniref:CDP-alcohol phosphatidyltransferase n=1 Tax=Intrasporangium sp. TaxID=1925024 RepID=UPI0026498AB1|nr:CDP-alcohol phosphatidyltransferase [Intrasporangium sp.]MDN5798001.1 CDP-alcohol phosphatidyltransferase [Intrasporangium sp.]
MALTVLAGALLWAALAMPAVLTGQGLAELLRLPVEVLVIVLLALALRGRALRVTAVVVGLLLGAVVLLKALNLGFHASLGRPFDALTDWSYLGPAVGVLTDWVGPGRARLITIGTGVLAAAVLVVLPLAAVRVMGALARRRRRVAKVLAALTAVWIVAALTGAAFSSGVTLASAGSSRLVWDTATRLRHDLTDRGTFARQVAADPFAAVPGDRLLTRLRGKDVLLVFVESYGRVALDDPEVAATVRPALARAGRELGAAGFSARSAYLTSPTFGGASWLAHSSVEAGLWVDSQQRYDHLLTTDRLTLARAFGKAGWRTVFDVPATTRTWLPGRSFYRFDTLYTAENVGYRGPRFGYATMPDQYTLQAFRDRELTPGHRPPVMAEIDLLSSHYPWTPPPPLLPWGSLGDGSVFGQPAGASPDLPGDRTADPRQVYAQTVAYAMRTLASFAATSNDPDLVIIAMGDHQPNSSVTRPGASHQVPAMVIAHDPALLAQVAGWGWDPGLAPASDAPVWPMSALRDRILTDFG